MYQIWYQRQIGPELIKVFDDNTWSEISSFTIVRNPLQRLVSAWRDKLGPMAEGDLLADKVRFFVSCIFSVFFYLNFDLIV